MTENIVIKTEQQMKNFASELALNAKKGDVFALSGNLGAGKTTFAQGFINILQNKELKVAEPVTSPTFNIIQIYKTTLGVDVWHCDLYRIKNKNELYDLGLEDAFDNAITLIEWPEIATNILPKNTLYIDIKLNLEGDRVVCLLKNL
jgi:tRNA threonylcarbamoyladenosine biosynthesis protein TsaE